MSFSLKQARYFIAAARSGQVSRAAVELNVSQSSVTAAIQQLETTLGVELFERRPNGVALTPAGSRFLNHAEHIIAVVNESLRVSLDAPGRLEGQVRLGLTYTVAGYFIAPLLLRFQRLFPGIKLEAHEGEREEIERDLIDGRADLAVILTSNLAHAGEIGHETLVRSPRRLWLPVDHDLLRLGEVHLADIARQPYIALTVDEAFQTAMRYWDCTPYRPQVLFRTSSVEAVRTMVASGMGVTILSDLVYRQWSLEGQRLETRDIIEPIPSMDVGVAWKQNAELSSPATVLQDYLVRNAHLHTRAWGTAARAREKI
jgi:DNA-binding transcriptional LysR family regulator